MNHSTDDRNHRILIIDDNRAIHDDFRKIFGGLVGDVALDAAEESLFGELPVKPPTSQFTLDSAYQGQEGFALVQQAQTGGVRMRWRSWMCGCRPAGTALRPSRDSGSCPRICRWSFARHIRITIGRR